MPIRHLLASACLAALGGCAMPGPGNLQSTDLRVPVTSTAPGMRGQAAQLYVREVTPADAAKLPVVLFVHGAGTPAEVSFDSRLEDYSWMRQVARAGFDVYSVSLTGYGGSTRPVPMGEPCNIAKAQQAGYVAAPCAPTWQGPITTMSSDWNDIDAVVEHVRRVRGVERVSMVAWSQGGPRVTGYAALHPGKVDRIVVLAPAYNRTGIAREPSPLPAFPEGAMTVQSRRDFIANWDRQVGCPAQYDPAAATTIFDEMLESDPVGAKWGTGVRRAPSVPTWGFNKEAVAGVKAPYLMVTGIHDKQVPPERVRELYEDLGSPSKVLVDLGCSSHNAMWEKNRKVLFDATVDWLRHGKVNGLERGTVRMGY
ncbi:MULTISPECIES: alpha/beta hydrolase [Ramlibacter]|nr:MULTISPECIES: alpha/beta fold hydrolase [Ramlibacter]MBA2961078.1 alpha/beta fold hydrolase [Ramlibacter sp. CGMCC 1.13660]